MMIRDRYLAGLGCLAVLIAGVPASAGQVSQEALAECAAKRSAAEKLACYEALTAPPAPPPAPAAEAAPESPPAAREKAPPAATPVPDDLGEEHLRREQGTAEPERLVATVREVTRSGSGRLYFHFTNGQVWRQNEARRFRYPPDGEFDVIISRGMMGDYQLRIDDGSPMTRISRVE